MEQIVKRLFCQAVFHSLNAATLHTENGLAAIQTNKETLKRLADWNWINAILNANQTELSEPRGFLVVN